MSVNLFDVFEVPIYLNIEPLNDTKCMHCNKDYQHRKAYRICKFTKLKEVEILTTCVICRSLYRKHKRLNSELLDTDWKLFSSKY
jgi:hypothetical protein